MVMLNTYNGFFSGNVWIMESRKCQDATLAYNFAKNVLESFEI